MGVFLEGEYSLGDRGLGSLVELRFKALSQTKATFAFQNLSRPVL
jgi:hypothetical protein